MKITFCMLFCNIMTNLKLYCKKLLAESNLWGDTDKKEWLGESSIYTKNRMILLEKESSRMYQEVAAVVFLYEFDEKNIGNIKSYSSQIRKVYAFDNSEVKNQRMVESLATIENLCYIDGHGNKGLGYAINYVLRECEKQNYKWLYTFDQDSRAETEMIQKMLLFLSGLEEVKKKEIGILAPSICQQSDLYEKGNGKYTYNAWVIQSGALHNVEVLKELDGYNEELFIDQVDYEYCLRLRKRQYKIIKLNDAILFQNVEDECVKIIRKWGRKLLINKYSPIRYYYVTRNVLFCTKLYKKINYQYYHMQRYGMHNIWFAMLYEPEKMRKMRAILLGIWDGCIGKMGKCKWKI